MKFAWSSSRAYALRVANPLLAYHVWYRDLAPSDAGPQKVPDVQGAYPTEGEGCATKIIP